MCKIVYLTRKSFNKPAKRFINALALELRQRNVEVVTSTANFIKSIAKKHKTYGVALAIDFFNDGKSGGGLTLNKRCSEMSKIFALTISDGIDRVVYPTRWRSFSFVSSDNSDWYLYFNKVSAETKVIFHLCTMNNSEDMNSFWNSFDNLVKSFADEIVRCLRSDYNTSTYIRSVKIAKRKLKQLNKIKERY